MTRASTVITNVSHERAGVQWRPNFLQSRLSALHRSIILVKSLSFFWRTQWHRRISAIMSHLIDYISCKIKNCVNIQQYAYSHANVGQLFPNVRLFFPQEPTRAAVWRWDKGGKKVFPRSTELSCAPILSSPGKITRSLKHNKYLRTAAKYRYYFSSVYSKRTQIWHKQICTI